MADPLELIRLSVTSSAEAIRWACLLEATSPKVGNVFPGRSFVDLDFEDFVVAAEITAETLGSGEGSITSRMLAAVQRVAGSTATNVNLGIVLLLGPLVAAEERSTPHHFDSCESWRAAVAKVLAGLDANDGQRIFQAIRTASPGGLGTVSDHDVNDDRAGEIDIIAAMDAAKGRDRIARQYAGQFEDLFGVIVPTVQRSIELSGDLMAGIVRGQLQILAGEPDSLIVRKNGLAIARDVQHLVQQTDSDDPAAVARLDEQLRQRGHQLNPGTTADLIAAALYVLLRTRHC